MASTPPPGQNPYLTKAMSRLDPGPLETVGEHYISPEDEKQSFRDIFDGIAAGDDALRAQIAALVSPNRTLPPVANAAALPTTGNIDGDIRVTLDDYRQHIWSQNAWHDIGATTIPHVQVTFTDVADSSAINPAGAVDGDIAIATNASTDPGAVFRRQLGFWTRVGTLADELPPATAADKDKVLAVGPTGTPAWATLPTPPPATGTPVLTGALPVAPMTGQSFVLPSPVPAAVTALLATAKPGDTITWDGTKWVLAPMPSGGGAPSQFKGSVANAAALPTTAALGDTYVTLDDGHLHICTSAGPPAVYDNIGPAAASTLPPIYTSDDGTGLSIIAVKPPTRTVALGQAAEATAAGWAIAIGSRAYSSEGVAIGGDLARAEGQHSTAIGGHQTVKGANSVGIGDGASTDADNSIAIGNGAKTDQSYQVQFFGKTQTGVKAFLGADEILALAHTAADSGKHLAVKADGTLEWVTPNVPPATPFKGAVANAAALPTTAALGDTYVTLDDGHLHVCISGSTTGTPPAKYDNIGPAGLSPGVTPTQLKPPVANAAALPTTGNTVGDIRVTLDDGHLHVWTEQTPGVGTWDNIGPASTTMQFVELTESAYAKLATTDPNTLYLITGL